MGEALGPLKNHGVHNWLDEVIIHTVHIEQAREARGEGTGGVPPVWAVSEPGQVGARRRRS